MIARVAIVALALLLGGCGGSGGRDEGGGNGAPPAAQASAASDDGAKACAAARETIREIPRPKEGFDWVVDYTDQAADALEKVDSPAVKPLRALDLAAAESGMKDWLPLKRINRAMRGVVRAEGDCGEREAARMLLPIVYAANLAEAMRDDRRLYRRSRTTDFVAAARADARRARVMAKRMRAAPVPARLRAAHRRFVASVVRLGARSAAAARDPASVSDAELDRVGDARVAALKALNRAIDPLVGLEKE